MNSLYHHALYEWHVEGIRTIPNPGRPPYYTEDFFNAIRTVRNEGLLNIQSMSLKVWYKVLLENFVTTEVDMDGFRFDKRCRIELEHPAADWERSWSLAVLPGLESCDYSFLWKMMHDILPTQARLHRILRTVTSPACTLCQSQDTCNLPHALFSCDYNNEVGRWLLNILNHHLPGTVPQDVILLNLSLDDHLRLPIVWLIAKTLSLIFNCRMDKKPCTLFNTRATLEASIMLLRKTNTKLPIYYTIY